jgi:glycosyltransferase involved in cell wall biosynthesis
MRAWTDEGIGGAGRQEGASALRRLSVLQVDPSLFTAPYDAALSGGLAANDVAPVWATRGLRTGEEDLLSAFAVDRFFYPLTDGARRRTSRWARALKGLEHGMGLRRLVRQAIGQDVVHFQWAPLPPLDRRAIAHIRRSRPVVMTVHDIKPFNGRPVSALQVQGYEAVLAEADHLIVHTAEGRDALIARGLPADRVSIVPHGLLPLMACPPESREPGARWRVVLFGRLQAYKGADLLVEALGRIDPATRERLEVIVAGEPQTPIDPIRERARELGLGLEFGLRDRRLSEVEMSALLRSADAFVFPYRSIDASGVLHLVAELDRWLIASDLGAFRAMLGGAPGAGALVPAENVDALASAIAASIGRRPTQRPAIDVPSWAEIGARTRAIYEYTIQSYASGVSR